MQKQIILQNKKLIYTLKKSKRAKRIRLVVHCDGSVVITSPYGLKESVAERFLIDKARWLLSKIAYFSKFKGKLMGGYSYTDYLMHRENARVVVEERISYFSSKYGYLYNRVSIKNQRTCWGSCSKKANLNFNYKILFIPKDIQDYVILHELCHLEELNHSKQFWKLVSNILPEYKEVKNKLKMYSLALR